MFLLLQAAAYASDDGILTEKMIDEKVADSLIAHTKKVSWQKEQETRGDTSASYVSSKDASAFTPPSTRVPS